MSEQAKPKVTPFVIKCPKPGCLNGKHDHDSLDETRDAIQYVEQVPMYYSMRLDKGTLHIDASNGETFYEGANAPKFYCPRCSTEWDVPKKVGPHIEWD